MTILILAFPLRTLAAAATLLTAVSDNAVILFDSTPDPAYGFDTISDAVPLNASFSTGGGSVELTQVKLMLRKSAPGSGAVSISLLSDSQKSPGPLLEKNIGAAESGAPSPDAQLVDIRVVSSRVLSANTRYWIEVSGSGNAGEWAYSRTRNGSGIASEFYKNSFGLHADMETGPYIMQVDAVAAGTVRN
jgi:hypothetical protein